MPTLPPLFRLTPPYRVFNQNQSCISPPPRAFMPIIIRINARIGVLYRTHSGYLPELGCYADWGRDNYPHRGV
jgi:hypothetical protein